VQQEIPSLNGGGNDVISDSADMIARSDTDHVLTPGTPYASPRSIGSLEECYFYHTMDVPGYGTINGEWDLRGSIDRYLGDFNFAGKRVLDVGAASGILSFHIEKQGAEVVSFDLSDDYDWDIVPFSENNVDSALAERRRHLKRINNGYWLCHEAFKSKAKMVNGMVYDIPISIGPLDVAVFGSILLHLRDPFLALENGARLAREAIIVSDISPYGKMASKFKRNPRFMPRGSQPEGISDGWFRLPPLLVKEYLAILGFKNFSLSWNDFKYGDRVRPIYTIIARR
jgi:SAM-dependent methyltransferase